MKLLVWLALGLLVYWAIRSQLKRNHPNVQHRPEPTQTKASKPAEKMVACGYCQLHLPISEAVHVVNGSSDLYFCSKEHALKMTNEK